MKILTPYGIQKFESYKKANSRFANWIVRNKWFVMAQTICFALAPVIIWLSELNRGYRAYGSEMLFVVAPILYKVGKWILHYDDKESDL